MPYIAHEVVAKAREMDLLNHSACVPGGSMRAIPTTMRFSWVMTGTISPGMPICGVRCPTSRVSATAATSGILLISRLTAAAPSMCLKVPLIYSPTQPCGSWAADRGRQTICCPLRGCMNHPKTRISQSPWHCPGIWRNTRKSRKSSCGLTGITPATPQDKP